MDFVTSCGADVYCIEWTAVHRNVRPNILYVWNTIKIKQSPGIKVLHSHGAPSSIFHPAVGLGVSVGISVDLGVVGVGLVDMDVDVEDTGVVWV